MTRYTMPARSQGKAFVQRTAARLERDDVHRWVFVRSLAPEVECAVRKWLALRLDGFYCDLQAMYTPHLRLHPVIRARTHVVLHHAPPPHAMATCDEAVEVDAGGVNARDAVKALIKATGLNPHASMCGWPFRLDDSNGVDDVERGMR